MYTRKTIEEKERLIADYKVSGLSMSKWCDVHNISTSTFSGLLFKKKKNISKSVNKARFVEISVPTEPQPIKAAAITVECNSFRISIPTDADLKALENILKVVAQINV